MLWLSKFKDVNHWPSIALSLWTATICDNFFHLQVTVIISKFILWFAFERYLYFTIGSWFYMQNLPYDIWFWYLAFKITKEIFFIKIEVGGKNIWFSNIGENMTENLMNFLDRYYFCSHFKAFYFWVLIYKYQDSTIEMTA